MENGLTVIFYTYTIIVTVFLLSIRKLKNTILGFCIGLRGKSGYTICCVIQKKLEIKILVQLPFGFHRIGLNQVIVLFIMQVRRCLC